MDLKFLGNWSSHIRKGVRNSSIILDDKIVFDFGPHTLESILERGIDPIAIEKVLISHMHLDHYLGLVELLWYRGMRKTKEQLTVMGPTGIRETTEKMLELVNTPGGGSYEVNVEYIESRNLDFIHAYEGNHIIPDNVYRVEYDNKVIVYTGDTAYSRNVVRAAGDADVLIHEMTYTDEEKPKADFWKHSTYSSVMETFEQSGARMLIPTHLTEQTYEQLSGSKKNREAVKLPLSDLTV